MCGIAGVLDLAGKPVDPELPGRMIGAIAHRGPDATDVYVDRHVGLGHARLSIIDVSGGAQPMSIADGSLWITFNGEIFNYVELRDELLKKGHRFATRSDTEVILHLYQEEGERCVERLNGQWAFAIWDAKRQKLFLSRDRLGVRPLFYTESGGRFVFASEIKALLECPGVDAQLDWRGLDEVFTFWCTLPGRTVFRNVSQLAPGHSLVVHDGRTTIQEYWKLELTPADDDDGDERGEDRLRDELLALLVDATRIRLRSDVPVGTYLSGGLDSTLVTALVKRAVGDKLRSFSVRFDDLEFDESPYQDEAIAFLQTDHSSVRCSHEDIGGVFSDVVWHTEQPILRTAPAPLFLLSRHVRNSGFKVVVTGEGADEVFGGYEKYLLGESPARRWPMSSAVQKVLSVLPWRPRGVDHLYRRTLTPRQQIRYRYSRYGNFPIYRKDLGQLFTSDFARQACIEQSFEPWERYSLQYGEEVDTDGLMRVDLQTYLSENCLVKTDRASMLASLEVRVPYLDELVLDRILPLRSDKKIVRGHLKSLLQPVVRRLLPRQVWDRPKHGFNVPIDARLSGSWNPLVGKALDWGDENLKIFNYPYLCGLHRISQKESGVSNELWNPVVLLTWAMAQSGQLIHA